MEVESRHQEITKLKTEKAGLRVKSKLFENFAAMAHSCCRRPSSAEWKTIKDTLQKTLEFSTELTGAENGNLVLLDNKGIVRSREVHPDHTIRPKPSEIIDIMNSID